MFILVIGSVVLNVVLNMSFLWLVFAAFLSIILFILLYNQINNCSHMSSKDKINWLVLILLFPPVIIIYLCDKTKWAQD
jgi:hypothetical protein